MKTKLKAFKYSITKILCDKFGVLDKYFNKTFVEHQFDIKKHMYAIDFNIVTK